MTRLAGAAAVFITAVVLANVMTARLGLVDVGFGLMTTAGTFAAGFALLARDIVQQAGGASPCIWVGSTRGDASTTRRRSAATQPTGPISRSSPT